MTTPHDYASKIASLLAMAESLSAQGNEAAAATYLAKASELQLAKQIADSDLRKARNDKAPTDEIIVRRARGVNKGAAYIKAKRDLLYGLCDIFNVKTTIAHDRSYVTMYGFESDLEFVQTMFDSLVLQLNSMMAVDIALKPAYESTRTWQTSYAHGYASRVVLRLRQARRRQEAEAITESAGTELMLRDRSVAVREYFDDYFKGRKLGSSYKNRSVRSFDGVNAGAAAGDRADLGGSRIETRRRAIEG